MQRPAKHNRFFAGKSPALARLFGHWVNAFAQRRHRRRFANHHGCRQRNRRGPMLASQGRYLGTKGDQQRQQQAEEQEFEQNTHGLRNQCRSYHYPYEAGMNPATNFAEGWKSRMKLVPWPSSDSARSVAPWKVAMVWAMGRPRP